jgi:hypothetical protein
MNLFICAPLIFAFYKEVLDKEVSLRTHLIYSYISITYDMPGMSIRIQIKYQCCPEGGWYGLPFPLSGHVCILSILGKDENTEGADQNCNHLHKHYMRSSIIPMAGPFWQLLYCFMDVKLMAVAFSSLIPTTREVGLNV